jgi:hypothetical protein
MEHFAPRDALCLIMSWRADIEEQERVKKRQTRVDKAISKSTRRFRYCFVDCCVSVQHIGEMGQQGSGASVNYCIGRTSYLYTTMMIVVSITEDIIIRQRVGGARLA